MAQIDLGHFEGRGTQSPMEARATRLLHTQRMLFASIAAALGIVAAAGILLTNLF